MASEEPVAPEVPVPKTGIPGGETRRRMYGRRENKGISGARRIRKPNSIWKRCSAFFAVREATYQKRKQEYEQKSQDLQKIQTELGRQYRSLEEQKQELASAQQKLAEQEADLSEKTGKAVA